MNLIEIVQDVFSQIPEALQPLLVALVGAIPFIEGEGAAALGVLAGVHPAVAIIAGIVGNFICVAILVFSGASVRRAVVNRQGNQSSQSEQTDEREARRWAKFQRSFERYGVPGVSLLGPLLLPTHFTATMLAASGIGRGRILFWQALAITLWTVPVALILTGVLSVIG